MARLSKVVTRTESTHRKDRNTYIQTYRHDREIICTQTRRVTRLLAADSVRPGRCLSGIRKCCSHLAFRLVMNNISVYFADPYLPTSIKYHCQQLK